MVVGRTLLDNHVKRKPEITKKWMSLGLNHIYKTSMDNVWLIILVYIYVLYSMYVYIYIHVLVIKMTSPSEVVSFFFAVSWLRRS